MEDSMKITTAAAALLVGMFANAASPQDAEIEGHWSGAVVRENAIQLVDVRLAGASDSLSGTYDIPELGLFDVPLREVSLSDSVLTLRILYGPFALHVHSDVGQLTGSNERWNPPLALHLKRQATPPERPFAAEEVDFANGDVKLRGLLVRPRGDGPFPALVAVHGSGEQGLQTWEYRSHAYALARRGIAVLLYDKRGVGASTGDYRTADFEALAGDAIAGIHLLRSRPDIRPSSVGLLGISQGGWISAVASRSGAKPSFIVMLQGPAVSLEEQELHRVRYSMQADGLEQGAIDAALAHTRNYFRFVNTSRGWEKLKASSEAAAASVWADYVNVAASPDDEDILWWRRNAYDPADDMRRVQCPVLAIFGEDDTAVPPAENREKMESYLSDADVPYSTTVVSRLPHSVTTYHDLKGGQWNWPDGFWVWSRRPDALDAAIAEWVGRPTR
jgi:pimeloyl-ACP methyl ester carboxylesterase